jgi:protein phosphatase
LANPDPAMAVTALLEAALDAGGRDNVSVVVVDAGDVPGGSPGEDDTIPRLASNPTEPLVISKDDHPDADDTIPRVSNTVTEPIVINRTELGATGEDNANETVEDELEDPNDHDTSPRPPRGGGEGK